MVSGTVIRRNSDEVLAEYKVVETLRNMKNAGKNGGKGTVPANNTTVTNAYTVKIPFTDLGDDGHKIGVGTTIEFTLKGFHGRGTAEGPTIVKMVERDTASAGAASPKQSVAVRSNSPNASAQEKEAQVEATPEQMQQPKRKDPHKDPRKGRTHTGKIIEIMDIKKDSAGTGYKVKISYDHYNVQGVGQATTCISWINIQNDHDEIQKVPDVGGTVAFWENPIYHKDNLHCTYDDEGEKIFDSWGNPVMAPVRGATITGYKADGTFVMQTKAEIDQSQARIAARRKRGRMVAVQQQQRRPQSTGWGQVQALPKGWGAVPTVAAVVVGTPESDFEVPTAATAKAAAPVVKSASAAADKPPKPQKINASLPMVRIRIEEEVIEDEVVEDKEDDEDDGWMEQSHRRNTNREQRSIGKARTKWQRQRA